MDWSAGSSSHSPVNTSYSRTLLTQTLSSFESQQTNIKAAGFYNVYKKRKTIVEWFNNINFISLQTCTLSFHVISFFFSTSILLLKMSAQNAQTPLMHTGINNKKDWTSYPAQTRRLPQVTLCWHTQACLEPRRLFKKIFICYMNVISYKKE